MAVGEAERTASTRRGIEAVALALLAILPTLPHLTLVLGSGVPRFGLFGDFALLEHATRHVWSGDTLVGPYSRFHWNHPGPLLFYAIAPFQRLFGDTSTGLYVGTWFVNAAAAAAMVALARVLASRAHAAGVLAGVLGWLFAFGNVTANPWNPLVIVLPLMAYLVAVALLASGRSAAVYPAVGFGALVAQTHVAAVSTIGVTAVFAAVAFVWRARRSGGVPRRERRRFVWAGALLAVLSLPPLVQQATAEGAGNIRRLASFFLDRPEPLKPAEAALHDWALATSWLPERVAGLALTEEGYIPLGMRWEPMPAELPRTATLIALALVLAVTLAFAVAWRRSDGPSAWLLAVGALANVACITSLRAIVGVDFHYLVFWTTAASSAAWMGVLAGVFSLLGGVAGRLPRPRVVAGAAALVGIAASVATTAIQHEWLVKYAVPPASRPEMRASLRAVHGALRERLARDGATPVIHLDGSWDMSDAMLLELEKDRVDVRVMARDRWLFFGVPAAEGAPAPLHVYFSTTPLPLPQAPCLELIARDGDVAMFGAPEETPQCPAP